MKFFLDFFKILIGNNSGKLTIKNLQTVIIELCGQLPRYDRDLIISKTITFFNVNSDEIISENKFVEVRLSKIRGNHNHIICRC